MHARPATFQMHRMPSCGTATCGGIWGPSGVILQPHPFEGWCITLPVNEGMDNPMMPGHVVHPLEQLGPSSLLQQPQGTSMRGPPAAERLVNNRGGVGCGEGV